MNVLFDTNVILDVFLMRDPYYKAPSHLLGFAEQHKIEGWICGTTVTTIHYLLAKTLSRKEAEIHLKNLLKIFHVSSVSRVVLEDALASNFKDFEDAVIYQSAVRANVEVILTRNQNDFNKSSISVYSPTAFLNILDTLE